MSTVFAHDLGFIGAGNMAEAIARAAVQNNLVPASRLLAADPSAARRELFAAMGIPLAAGNAQVVRESAQVLLAVKPQMFATVAPELAPLLSPEHVVISIMAGIGTGKIAAQLATPANPQPRIIRVMPNTPLMVGLGMSGVARGAHAREGDEKLTLQLFGAAGKVVLVPEEEIDAITAVSGSGPAYIFYLAEAMEAAATELGLGEHARTLVQQTIQGAATLLAQSPDTAAELRRKVTSPGGTTEAALKHMDGNATTRVIVNAIKAAQLRARELGK